MKKWFLSGASSIFFSALCWQNVKAQFSLSAQLRTRTELRDGQGGPLPAGAKPAVFTSQRSRLSAAYAIPSLKLGLALQDVRVWGQDASTIHRTTTADNNGFMLHEAWAEVNLADSLQLKIGRQELVYDDSRLLGNLDWLQQGRRHDAALLKFRHSGWVMHLGGAFNQNKENAAGTVYNPTPPGNYPANTNGGQQYKSMEFLYVQKMGLSFLFLADQFSRYTTDSTGAKQWQPSAHNRMTTGLFYTWKKRLTLAAYYQFGHTPLGESLGAALLSAAYRHPFHDRFSAEAGIDYTTGGNAGNAFDPLYGTPHKFWGAMDYFYVASGFGNKGLQDYYLRGQYKPSSKWMIGVDVHQFFSAASYNFGMEADVSATCQLSKFVAVEGGYSHFRSTSHLAAAKNVADAQNSHHWAWLSLNIKPELFSR
ncbi:alginate export family protein [Chitinophaga alhagiae]|uniref:alginate export family protein n=1 Tax=Chitinophaga alhagiae TaxID=2203219 RepID=UPI000E5AE65A|nr:alginate export family protein [Chitinophaga alhagiae]